MDDIVICTRKGLLYGRTYLWYGTDLLVIEGLLSPDKQQQAIDDAFTEVRERSLLAATAV